MQPLVLLRCCAALGKFTIYDYYTQCCSASYGVTKKKAMWEVLKDYDPKITSAHSCAAEIMSWALTGDPLVQGGLEGEATLLGLLGEAAGGIGLVTGYVAQYIIAINACNTKQCDWSK